MGTLLTGNKIRKAVEESTFIQQGDTSCAEGVKYDFRLGYRILKAHFGRPIDASQLSESEKKDLNIESGEVVFVLSHERLALPADVMAQLSPKRKLSHAGILTLGGFCVDPGYHGHLLLGLFNLSSTAFPLIPKKKLVGATFYRLEGEELGTFPPPPAPLDDFPPELVRVIKEYRPVAVQQVAQAVGVLERELSSLKNEIRSHEQWYQRFKELLEKQSAEIEGLRKGLSEEIEARKSGHDQLSKVVRDIDRSLSFLRGAAWIVTGIIGFAAALLAAWLGGLFGH